MGAAETAAAATVAIAIGSFWFWVLFVVAANIIILTAIEYERGGLATVTFFATLAGLQVLCGVPILSYIWMHPLFILLAAGCFGAIGCIWAIGKWYFYVKNKKDAYDDLKEDFLEQNGVNDGVMTNDLKVKFTQYLMDNRYDVTRRGLDADDLPPKPKNHKGDIAMWISYWPWSMTWTLLNDPVKRIGKWIYRKISGTLENISFKVFKGMENDILTPEQLQMNEEAKRREKEEARVQRFR